MDKRLKRVFKTFGIFAIADLVYLNILVPVTLSIQQVFQENGFSFLPNMILSAYASGELVPLSYRGFLKQVW